MSNSTRVTICALLSLAALPLAGCGEKSETTRAAGLTPASAVAFVSITTAPSTSQSANLLQFIKKANPKDNFSNQEQATDHYLRELTEDLDFDLNYERDVKSWVGSEIAIASFVDGPEDRDGAAESGTALIVDYTSVDASRAALLKWNDELKKSQTSSKRDMDQIIFALINGKAIVVSPDQEWILDRFKAVEKKESPSLSSSARFKKTDDQTNKDRLMFAWVDVSQVMKAAQSNLRTIEDEDRTKTDQKCLDLDTTNYPVVQASLRAEPDEMSLKIISSGKGETSGGLGKHLESLPRRTAFAMSYFAGPVTKQTLTKSLGEQDSDCSLPLLLSDFYLGGDPLSIFFLGADPFEGIGDALDGGTDQNDPTAEKEESTAENYIDSIESDLKELYGLDLQSDILDWLSGEVTFLLGTSSGVGLGLAQAPDMAIISSANSVKDADKLERTQKLAEAIANIFAVEMGECLVSSDTDFDPAYLSPTHDLCQEVARADVQADEVSVSGADRSWIIRNRDESSTQLIVGLANGQVIIASSQEYAEKMLRGDQPGLLQATGTEEIKADSQKRTTFAGVVNFDGVAELLKELDVDEESLEEIRRLKAFSFAVYEEDEFTKLDLSLSVR